MAKSSARGGGRGAIAWAAIGLTVVLGGAGGALSQARKEEPPATSKADEGRLTIQDEIEIAEARVDAKKAEVRFAQNRLERVRAALVSIEDRFRKGITPESSVVAGRLDAIEHEARLEMRQAELKERQVRLRALKRATAGAAAAPGGGLRVTATTPPDDLPLRLDWAERRITDLEEARSADRRAGYTQAQ